MTAAQLDLFGDLDADTARRVDALICIRDEIPQAMEIVIHLADWRIREDRSPGRPGNWLYTIRRDGIDARRCGTTLWQHISWAELADLVGDDPRRPGLIAWSQSLTAADAWKDRLRPHELWPEPEKWHPSCFELDHQRDGWEQRIAAWRDLYALLDDAIARLEGAAA